MVLAERTTGGLGGALRLLSDPTRLRILALLEAEELSVGELARSLAVSQSRVSNHLRLLREAELLVARHAGASTYLRLDPGVAARGPAGRLWSALRAELDSVPEHHADRVRLASVLAERGGKSGDFFDRLAGQWDKLAGDFENGRARERAAAQLLPAGFVVADLGSGPGTMAAPLLGLSSRLICVDRSAGMLEQAEKRLAQAPRGTVLEFRRGDLDALPLDDGEVDGVVAGLVLHHLEELDRPLAEMARVLKPGGHAVVLELAPHREEWMRAALGDRHLGLEPSDVLAAFERAGFEDLRLEPADDRYRPRRPDDTDGVPVSLSMYLVRGRRPVVPNTQP